MRYLKFFCLFLLPMLSKSCVCKGTVNPNEWVITTATCWNTSTVAKAGDAIPRLISACDRAVVLPATEMGADFQTDSKFKGRVAGRVSISYRWRIVEPLKFLSSAKSITSAPTSGDHKIDPNALEELENSIVDKMLSDICRELTPNMDAGTDELTIERELQKAAEPQVDLRGVEFSGMSVNVMFDPQTEEALGVLSALNFYKASGEEELGRKVILQKAGAANITTQQKE